ncbi:hypothetical protein OG792_07820 [Micromonospora sp. NBC_01699]|uniref:hypothetical protein n=1 Tax=Micromonospora sp. NBC_01699 TaxID=2975984 RepID=UPI002E319A24|nr:hypothetical protein [Micromonospora sp. NBC_01699]
MSQPLNGPDDPPPVDPTTPLPPVTAPGAAYAPPPYHPPVSALPTPGAPVPGGSQPYPGVPVSGGPQPYPGAPMSGVPMSGVPVGQPMSAPPGPGLPYGPPPPVAGGRRRTVLVLSIVVALLFSVGAVMTGLFVTKNNELTRTERELGGQVADRDTRLAANSREIERLNRGLEAANDRIKAVEQDLTGTKNDRDEQARQKAVIANCLDLFSKAMTATSESAFKKAIDEADKVCAEADGYL